MKTETLIVILLITLGIAGFIAAGYVGGKRADAQVEIIRINCEGIEDE